MKKIFLLTLLSIMILGSASFAVGKFIKVDRQTDLPSFIGYVQDEFIVVLKEDQIPSNQDKSIVNRNALSGVDEFDVLVRSFDVEQIRPQFQNQSLHKAASQNDRELAKYFKVKFNSGDLDKAMAAFQAAPQVERVEPIGIHTIYATPNDTYYDDPPASFPYDQWHYWDNNSIDADQAWDTETGSSNVVVGILDSGTRYFHRDLGGDSGPWGPGAPFVGGNIFINPNETANDGIDNDGNGYTDDMIGWDFVQSAGGGGVSCIDQDCGTADNDPDDGDGHGTHVSGTVGAITNNGILVAGVAGGYSDGTQSGVGNGVRILPCRIGYHAKYRGVTTGIVRMDYAAEAMNYIAGLIDDGHNVTAINCSWGSSNSGGLGAAVDALIARDVLIVVAAGNSNSSSPDYLGARTDCMDVAATDAAGNGASFSNYGSWVDVAAPGVEILSTFRNPDDPDPLANYIALLDGTSMSAPHVVGIAALLESCQPGLSATQKFTLIVDNTTPYSDSRDLGSGIANAFLALSAAGCASCAETTPVADFSGSPTSGDAPLTVNFTDLSSNNPDGWTWDFGDGGNSSAQNPSHQYTSAGTYTVSLTASNCAGSDGETKVAYITVTDPPCTATTPVANFSGSPTSGTAPLTVNFSDLSTNSPDTWSWNFGDGGNSSAQNPSHQYTSAGTYTVSLTASNCAGSDGETKVAYITVNPPAVDVMHVHNIVVTRANKGPNWNGVGTITIYNQNEQPVANATVTVLATGPTGGTGTATTGANGTVSFQTSKIKNPSGEWCFEVTNVTHASNTYNSAGNHVTKACESGVVFSSSDPTAMSGLLPEDFALNQNYPNPFNPTTQITFSLPQASDVELTVYNLLGQRISTLVDGYREAGQHTIEWNATNKDGARVPSGVYLYRLVAGQMEMSKKMVLLK